jgi:hypothetical protein
VKLTALILGLALTACGGTGSDTTHWSCWEPSYLAANPTLGTSPHKFNAGSGKDHICTKAELDAAGIDPSLRPADQR